MLFMMVMIQLCKNEEIIGLSINDLLMKLEQKL